MRLCFNKIRIPLCWVKERHPTGSNKASKREREVYSSRQWIILCVPVKEQFIVLEQINQETTHLIQSMNMNDIHSSATTVEQISCWRWTNTIHFIEFYYSFSREVGRIRTHSSVVTDDSTLSWFDGRWKWNEWVMKWGCIYRQERGVSIGQFITLFQFWGSIIKWKLINNSQRTSHAEIFYCEFLRKKEAFIY